MKFDVKLMLAVLGVLAASLTASWPALAAEGCHEFQGRVDDQTKGEGGSRTGAGFSKGDRLMVTVYEPPGSGKEGINLLEYASPDGPFHELTEDVSDSFTYTVPKNTNDFIYLNFSGAMRGMVVSWSCAPAGD